MSEAEASPTPVPLQTQDFHLEEHPMHDNFALGSSPNGSKLSKEQPMEIVEADPNPNLTQEATGQNGDPLGISNSNGQNKLDNNNNEFLEWNSTKNGPGTVSNDPAEVPKIRNSDQPLAKLPPSTTSSVRGLPLQQNARRNHPEFRPVFSHKKERLFSLALNCSHPLQNVAENTRGEKTHSGKERCIFYDKKLLLKFKSLDICNKPPHDLPDLVIVKGPPQQLSQKRIKGRINHMRAEYRMNKDVEELLVAMDKLRCTKDAGVTLVSKSADAILDCKAAEREAIVDITRILFENGRLSKDEIQAGLADFIGFIDNMVIDCPKLFEFIGEWLGVFFVRKAVDVQWFCDALEKTKANPDTRAPEKLTIATIRSIQNTEGIDAATECFASGTEALNKLLGAYKWSAISNDLLG